MHNIDGTSNEYEFNPSYQQDESGFEFGNQEYEFSNVAQNEYGYQFEGEGEGEEETMELELASEFLNVSNEQELDMFIGKLISRAARGVKRFANSAVGQQLIGGLKGIAKKALPALGTAAGTFFGGPLGGAIGGKLGSLATNLFEVDLQGMSNEDSEFEIARRFVKFASQAAKNAALKAATGRPPGAVVNNAIRQAASAYAPGLLRRAGVRTGRWYQTPGGDIVLKRAAF